MALTREEVGTRYGVALFGYAQDTNTLDDTYQEMTVLQQIVEENPKMLVYLSDPILNMDEKQKFLDSISQNFNSQIQAFLNLVLEYNRMSYLSTIIDHFMQLYDDFNKIARGQAITAIKLNDAQLKNLEASYAKSKNLHALKLKNIVDPSIIGGVVLKVKDQVIDGSVKAKLNKIRAQLINNE